MAARGTEQDQPESEWCGEKGRPLPTPRAGDAAYRLHRTTQARGGHG